MSLKLAIISVFLIIMTFVMIFWINSIQIPSEVPKKDNGITSFEQCEAKGYPIQESYPRKCSVPGGETFTENINASKSPQVSPEASANSDGVSGICEDKCGDDQCQLIVCQGSNCPCAENELNCPQDCR